jgi:hypothetical protein
MQAAATSHSANFDDYGYGSNDNPYTGYSAESYVMSDVGMGMGMGAAVGGGYE